MSDIAIPQHWVPAKVLRAWGDVADSSKLLSVGVCLVETEPCSVSVQNATNARLCCGQW